MKGSGAALHLGCCSLEDAIILLEEDTLGQRGYCVLGEGTWRWSLVPLPHPSPPERAESECTRDMSCAVHPLLCACAAGWGWCQEAGRAWDEFVTRQLAGGTACSGCASQPPCPQAGWQ